MENNRKAIGWQVELQQEKEHRNELLTKPELAEESRTL